MEMINRIKAWWNMDSMDLDSWNFLILQLLVYLSLQLIISVILDLGKLSNTFQSDIGNAIAHPFISELSGLSLGPCPFDSDGDIVE